MSGVPGPRGPDTWDDDLDDELTKPARKAPIPSRPPRGNEERIPAPAPGIYPGVPFAEYLAWDACSHSQLEDMRRSPEYCLLRRGRTSKPTAAMELGTAFHIATLEPLRFPVEYAVRPEGNATKLEENGGCKRAYDAAKASGKILLTAEQYAGCTSVAVRIAKHPDLGPVICAADYRSEVAAVADIEVDGAPLRVKIRLDSWAESLRTIMDLKSSLHAIPRDFGRELDRFGHYRQAALYLQVMAALGRPDCTWLWAAFNNTAPFELFRYRTKPSAIQLAGDENALLLSRYARCSRSGVWTETETEDETGEIDLPFYRYSSGAGVDIDFDDDDEEEETAL